MPSVTEPAQVDHPVLRELALRAASVAKLEEAVEALEDLIPHLSEDEDEAEPSDEDPLAVALPVVQAAYEDADRELEANAIAWLAADPEHWPIFRLVLLDPWQEEPRGGGARSRPGCSKSIRPVRWWRAGCHPRTRLAPPGR